MTKELAALVIHHLSGIGSMSRAEFEELRDAVNSAAADTDALERRVDAIEDKLDKPDWRDRR